MTKQQEALAKIATTPKGEARAKLLKDDNFRALLLNSGANVYVKSPFSVFYAFWPVLPDTTGTANMISGGLEYEYFCTCQPNAELRVLDFRLYSHVQHDL